MTGLFAQRRRLRPNGWRGSRSPRRRSRARAEGSKDLRTRIAHNTFIAKGAGGSWDYATRWFVATYAGIGGTGTILPPEDTLIANNVLMGPGTTMLAADLGSNPIIVRNLFDVDEGTTLSGPTGHGPIVDSSGLTPEDETGVFVADSAAIDRAVGVGVTTPFDSADPGSRNLGCRIDIGHLEFDGACSNTPSDIAAFARGVELGGSQQVGAMIAEALALRSESKQPTRKGWASHPSSSHFESRTPARMRGTLREDRRLPSPHLLLRRPSASPKQESTLYR